MPCAIIACACSALSRIASKPPCTFGCRVLTRPSIISGNPVSSETSLTFNPTAAIALAVPPVETKSMPWAASARATSTSPDLAETDNNARGTRRGWSVMGLSWAARPPRSTVLSAMKPAKSECGNLRPRKMGAGHHSLQRQFRFTACIASRCRRRNRSRRADKAPADAGGLPRILANHDLGGAAGTVVSRQKHAVFEVDLVVQRLEGPDVAVRQHQHHAAGVAEPTRLDRGVQVKSQRVISLVALDPGAGRRRQGVLAVEPRSVMCDHQYPAMHHAEARQIAVMRGRQQHAVADHLAIAFHVGRAADDRCALQEPLHGG